MAIVKSVLVTGANGFIGRETCKALTAIGYTVRIALRNESSFSGDVPIMAQEHCIVGDIDLMTDWSAALAGVDIVIHLAGRVHIMKEKFVDSLTEYKRINVEGTTHLAQQAVKVGVQRFIFTSSIKVNGEVTFDRPFREDDLPAPQDPYSLSKWEAEQALSQLAKESQLEVVILRLPLVYGPGVKGNFLRLMKIIDRCVPLPLKSIQNQRSLLYLGNLVSALGLCIQHPQAVGQMFLVSDGEDVSTPELVQHIAKALDCSAHLIPFSPFLLRLGGQFIGKSDAVDRLLGSLVVDNSKIRQDLGWCPPFNLEQGLRESAYWFREKKMKKLRK